MPDSILILQEHQSEPDCAAIELARAGYRVVSVPTLAVAIAWLRVNDPALIVAPVHLIDDDIFELLRFVRGDFQLRFTKILLCCLMPSPFTTGMSRTISSAAKAMGANAVFIGEGGKVFDRSAFWLAVGPLLPEAFEPGSFFVGSEASESFFESYRAQEQTFPPGE
ncbi:hypothetical protein KBI23_27815 [bacterium]|nr:hypothetical protein [bacterium]